MSPLSLKTVLAIAFVVCLMLIVRSIGMIIEINKMHKLFPYTYTQAYKRKMIIVAGIIILGAVGTQIYILTVVF